MTALLDSPRLTVPVDEHDHTLGSPTAPVTMVEYGDYECPYCGAAYPITKELHRMLGDELLFAYRHFPLSQIHHHALPAANAAEAAGAQGKFWQMHELLFTHQDRLDTPDLLGYGESLRLDMGRFTQDVEQGTYVPVVRRHFLSGVRSGVNGTPTFFINGVRHNGGWDLPSLLEAIRASL